MVASGNARITLGDNMPVISRHRPANAHGTTLAAIAQVADVAHTRPWYAEWRQSQPGDGLQWNLYRGQSLVIRAHAPTAPIPSATAAS